MGHPIKRDPVRRRLLDLLFRTQLDEIAQVEKPWSYDRKPLCDIILDQWPHDDIAAAVLSLLERAK